MNFVVTEFAAVKRWPLYLYLIYRGNISFTLRKKKRDEVYCKLVPLPLKWIICSQTHYLLQ